MRIQRDDLREVVEIAAGAVATRRILPVLGCLRLGWGAGKLIVEATDFEVWLQANTLEARYQDNEEHAVCVPAAPLRELLRQLPSGEVTVEVDDANAVTLCAGRGEYVLRGLPAAEYPSLPDVWGVRKVQMEAEAISRLRSGLDSVLFAVATDETRALLTGVCLQYLPGGCRWSATDTHRLAVWQDAGFDPALWGETLEAERGEYILPMHALKILRPLLKGVSELTLRLCPQNAVAETAQNILGMRLLEGQFPNFERVIPQETTWAVTLSREELEHGLKRVGAILPTGEERVVLDIYSIGVELRAESGELGRACEKLDTVEVTGDSVTMALNASYLLGALGAVGTEQVTLAGTGPLNPIVLRGVDLDEWLSMLMPMGEGVRA